AAASKWPPPANVAASCAAAVSSADGRVLTGAHATSTSDMTSALTMAWAKRVKRMEGFRVVMAAMRDDSGSRLALESSLPDDECRYGLPACGRHPDREPRRPVSACRGRAARGECDRGGGHPPQPTLAALPRHRHAA